MQSQNARFNNLKNDNKMEVSTITKKHIKISGTDIRKAIIAMLYDANEIQTIGEIDPASINFEAITDNDDNVVTLSASVDITKEH